MIAPRSPSLAAMLPALVSRVTLHGLAAGERPGPGPRAAGSAPAPASIQLASTASPPVCVVVQQPAGCNQGKITSFFGPVCVVTGMASEADHEFSQVSKRPVARQATEQLHSLHTQAADAGGVRCGGYACAWALLWEQSAARHPSLHPRVRATCVCQRCRACMRTCAHACARRSLRTEHVRHLVHTRPCGTGPDLWAGTLRPKCSRES